MSNAAIDTILAQASKGKLDGDRDLALKAVELAEHVLSMANANMSIGEKRQADKLSRMMEDHNGKALTLAMADVIFRPPTYQRGAEMFRYLVDSYGVPEYLSLPERVAMLAGSKVSTWVPDIVMPAVKRQLRSESNKVILPSEANLLKPHLKKRRQEGIRMNLNQLGEAILGEDEASHRLEQVVARLSSEDCNYISVKISAIFSQINLLDFEGTVVAIQERLRKLYRCAQSHPALRPDGSKGPKFVNLDMEEYRDLHLTCEAFKRTLMEPEFLQLEAGIVLQAYLPDSHQVMIKLLEWAKQRVQAGGATIKIRIVKGANLAMEKVEAALHDWPQAPYYSKADVDANFKRMLHLGCQPENAKVARIGLASHNLFDLCYTLLLRERNQVSEYIELEMLEGMANHQARIIKSIAGDLLLYAPVVSANDFPSAIAYLVRRLDENTSEENFLHDLFGMTPGSRAWEIQKQRFLKAVSSRDEVQDHPNRLQDKNSDSYEQQALLDYHASLDTDWALPANQRWLQDCIKNFKQQLESGLADVPMVINAEEIHTQFQGPGRDPSQPEKIAYRYSYAREEHVEKALQCAKDYQPVWQATSMQERGELLKKVAQHLETQRGKILPVMMMDAGKAAYEADAEFSECVDFANFYANGLLTEGFQDGIKAEALGSVLITPPWNFPFAIPCGGVLAALVAGNTVIIKPAPETVLTAWYMVNALWEAGVPKQALQFICTEDNHIGQSLVMDQRINAVVLTGSWDTARLFQGWKPEMRLFAETSGKNCLIITSTADPDLAIKDLVKSAFGHAGQKCSAASLALVAAEVYDNPAFMRQLKDAANSLVVDAAWNLGASMCTLISEPSPNLKRALTTLDAGEEWLLEPRMLANNPNLWSPGIKLGVKADSWLRHTECFGPVLGLIRVESLAQAISIQNASEFGLTGGIHALDPREIEEWKAKVEVGNAYINRPITGAIVNRQPFGGWKKSCFGPGAKAGGPNYVSQFVHWHEEALPSMLTSTGEQLRTLVEQLCTSLAQDGARIRAAAGSQATWYKKEFSQDHDPAAIHGESNIFRYRAYDKVIARFDAAAAASDIAIAILAASHSNTRLVISMDKLPHWLASLKLDNLECRQESLSALLEALPQLQEGGFSALRMPGAGPDVYSSCNNIGLSVLDMPILANGRIELLRWHREQAVSQTLHRYGNIIPAPQA